MKIDKIRVNQLLMEITKNSSDLEALVNQNTLAPDSIELKAAKYILIEIAEGIAHILQHLLAKKEGLAVSGYLDTLAKGHGSGVISNSLYNQLKPFMHFRHSLVHRYWTIDDTLLIRNIVNGYQDFRQFVEEIETYLA